MANDKLNKELISHMMDEAAWKELSKNFPKTFLGQSSCSRSIGTMWTGMKFQGTAM